MSGHVVIAEIPGAWLLHLDLGRPGVGPVMVLERWTSLPQTWVHVRDIVGSPSTLGIDWDDAENRPRDPEAAHAALEKLTAPPTEQELEPRDDRDFADLSADEQHEYILERAQLIANRTPMEDGESWDDTEEWLGAAAELAHAVVSWNCDRPVDVAARTLISTLRADRAWQMTSVSTEIDRALTALEEAIGEP